MADVKFSALPAAGALTGAESLVGLQGGAAKLITVDEVTTYAGLAVIGGLDTYVQFNDGGAFGGDAGFTYDKATNTSTTGYTKVGGGGLPATDATVYQTTITANDAAADFAAVVFANNTQNGGYGATTYTYAFNGTAASPTQVAALDYLYTVGVFGRGDNSNWSNSGSLIYTAGGFAANHEVFGFWRVDSTAADGAGIQFLIGSTAQSEPALQFGKTTANPAILVRSAPKHFTIRGNSADTDNDGTTLDVQTAQLGAASAVTGLLKLAHASSAFLTTFQAGNAAAAVTYTLPTNVGAADSVLTDSAGDGTLSWTAKQTTNLRRRQLTFTLDGGGAAIANGSSSFCLPCVYSGELVAWTITVDTGTCTLKTWKVAAGTAIPTVGDSISTSGVAISSGTVLRSTTVSDFTDVTFSANDLLIANVTAISGPTRITFTLELIADV